MSEANPLILVVDDEDHLAHLTSLFLKKGGYRTLTATSVESALCLWNPAITMLLTDFIMPEMPGDRFANLLLRRKPSLKVLFMSANNITSLESSIPLEEGFNFIQKPFCLDNLLRLVRNSLSLNVPASEPG